MDFKLSEALTQLAGFLASFLATGAEKADAVRRARAGDGSVPAGRIRTSGEVIWFLDSAAAPSD